MICNRSSYQNDAASYRTSNNTQPQKSFSILFCQMKLFCTDGLTKINGSRIGYTKGNHRCQLSCNLRHGICCHRSTSQMTDHCCIRCRSKSPHHFIQDHRARINQEIFQQHLVDLTHIDRVKSNVMVFYFCIPDYNDKFYDPCCQSSDCRTHNSHLR